MLRSGPFHTGVVPLSRCTTPLAFFSPHIVPVPYATEPLPLPFRVLPPCFLPHAPIPSSKLFFFCPLRVVSRKILSVFFFYFPPVSLPPHACGASHTGGVTLSEELCFGELLPPEGYFARPRNESCPPIFSHISGRFVILYNVRKPPHVPGSTNALCFLLFASHLLFSLQLIPHQPLSSFRFDPITPRPHNHTLLTPADPGAYLQQRDCVSNFPACAPMVAQPNPVDLVPANACTLRSPASSLAATLPCVFLECRPGWFFVLVTLFFARQGVWFVLVSAWFLNPRLNFVAFFFSADLFSWGSFHRVSLFLVCYLLVVLISLNQPADS